MPENPWEPFQRRDRKREPLLLILTPLTPTREEAILTVMEILMCHDEPITGYRHVATAIIDALTKKRET